MKGKAKMYKWACSITMNHMISDFLHGNSFSDIVLISYPMRMSVTKKNKIGWFINNFVSPRFKNWDAQNDSGRYVSIKVLLLLDSSYCHKINGSMRTKKARLLISIKGYLVL